LLESVLICYKPDMRKWMRDRLQRRKKTAEEAAQQPAPLQPAYFNAEESSTSEPATEHIEAPQIPEAQAGGESEAVREGEARQETPSESGESATSVAGAGEARRPRRRRRGGRGRKRTAAPATAATPAPAPEVPRAVTPPPDVRPAASKGEVVLAIGLPGSGKSSWFKRNKINPLSSDLLRALLFDDPTEQRFQDLVFSNLRSMLRARLIARRPLNYVDATNLTPHDRHSWIKLAKDFGYEVQAVYFDVPLEVCLERNQRRQRAVSEEIMRQMAGKLRPPSFEEGFSKITVVRVRGKASKS
jgi:predicted kinase